MDVFVYGTLLDPHQALAVVPDATFGESAKIDGLHLVPGRYPTLAPGGSVDGQILQTDDVATLDKYEGVDDGLYIRLTAPAEDGRDIHVYIGDPERLDPSEPVTWPGEGSLTDRVERYIAEEDVLVQIEA